MQCTAQHVTDDPGLKPTVDPTYSKACRHGGGGTEYLEIVTVYTNMSSHSKGVNRCVGTDDPGLKPTVDPTYSKACRHDGGGTEYLEMIAMYSNMSSHRLKA